MAFVNTKPFLHLVLSYGEIARKWQYRMSINPRQKGSMMGKSPDPILPCFLGKGFGRVRLHLFMQSVGR